MNVQVVCTLDGELGSISDLIEGARHEVFCLDESGALVTLNPCDWTGDKGYVGRDMEGYSAGIYPISQKIRPVTAEIVVGNVSSGRR
jgi:hypothetical protein